jgi:hypothetical protein
LRVIYLTIRVSCVEVESDPEVAVTVMVKLPVLAVEPDPLLELPPPQEPASSRTAMRSAMTAARGITSLSIGRRRSHHSNIASVTRKNRLSLNAK